MRFQALRKRWRVFRKRCRAGFNRGVPRPAWLLREGIDKLMDGMTDLAIDLASSRQHTLKTAIGCTGVALHSGASVSMSLLPAPPDTGIVFRRTDLGVDIPARFSLVTETRLCTQLTHPDDGQVHVRTVEHVMAALSGLRVDNAIVAVDGPELPVLDGSAAPVVFLIDCAGRVAQDAPRRAIQVLKPVRVEHNGASAELRPAGSGLDLALSIDFPAEAIGRQALTMGLSEADFRGTLAGARTFTMVQEIEAMQLAGLARGGSLKNAVVVDGAKVLNPEGLRAPDEFVRHKLLDAVGDLALAGARLQGRFLAHRTGHALNNRLLRELFADASAWRAVSLEPAAWSRAPYGVIAEAA
jgi:UDP-3-O-[3-hydroxymyristoyl] N-acetylglucosamine deacetylase